MSKTKTVKLSGQRIVSPEEVARFRAESNLRAARAEVDSMKRTVRYWQDVADVGQRELDSFLACGQKTKRLIIKPRRNKRTSETTPIAVFSDWHVEETVDPESVNGLNTFNLEIADRRIQRCFQKTLDLIQNWRLQDTDIQEMVLALLGDFMSGYIHEELMESNSLSPIETIIWVQRRLVAGIRMLLDRGDFKKIRIPCCVGNHGRVTPRMRIQTSHKNSYEWLMYNQMALTFDGDPRVEFYIPQCYHTWFTVYDRPIRAHHGDSIRYQGGVGGISIPVNKAISEWNKANPAWIDIFGHWHQALDGKRWVSNGSLIGYNAYALSIKAAYEEPVQQLLFVEKTLGKTGVLPLILK